MLGPEDELTDEPEITQVDSDAGKSSSAFWRDVSETAVARFFLLGISAVSTVLVARVLGPEGRGAYSVAVAISAIGLRFGNFGLHSSNTYFVARDRKLLPGLLGNSLVVGLFIAGAGSLGAGTVFAIVPSIAPLSGWLMVLAFAWIPIGLTYLLFQSLLLGVGEIRAFNLVEIFGRSLPLVLMAALIVVGWTTPSSFMASALLGLAISCFWAYLILQRHACERPSPSLKLFKSNIAYGFKAYIAAFFAYLVLRSDLLVISYMLGLEEVGFYSVAVALTEVLAALPIAIGTVLFPRLSALQSDDEKLKISVRVALITGLILGAASLAVGLFATPIIILLFGAGFTPAASALVWLLPGVVAMSSNRILMNYFASLGMPAITVWSPGVAAALNLILNLALVPRLGIRGASITSTIAYVLMLVTSGIYIRYWRTRRPPHTESGTGKGNGG